MRTVKTPKPAPRRWTAVGVLFALICLACMAERMPLLQG